MPSDGGVFYRRNDPSEEFFWEQPTDIFAYDEDDTAHVNWWYEPIRNGGPTWMAPYHNENVDKYLISYVIPIYLGDVLVGIAGMDINYYEIIRDVKAVRCYETGYAFLCDSEGTAYYNPHYDDGTMMEDMEVSGNLSFKDENNGAKPITYMLGNVEKQMAYRTLSNGMRLGITAPTQEIYSTSNNLMRQVVISTVLVLLIFLLLTLMVSRRITGPLKELADVAKQINEGKLEVTFPKETKDEVGELTHALEKMVHHLKHHIDDLNSLAYHDSLTGVKNKTAYDDAAAKLDETNGDKEYGIVVLDANNLKKINDTYGHERGNIYLQNACRLTCRIFKGSPVFRIGGDEFVVLLQGDDYDNCYKLMHEFDTEAERINEEAENDWEKINIAKGMVKYDPGTDPNVESVFKRADARMYVAKQKMKLAEIQ
jgi:diguanylate cyclase (GGDEF)-like protein